MTTSNDTLISNLDKLHTTEAGKARIRNNLELPLSTNPVTYCKELIESPDCDIYKNGKNFYCVVKGIMITVNASSYTVITAKQGERF